MAVSVDSESRQMLAAWPDKVLLRGELLLLLPAGAGLDLATSKPS